MAYTDKPNDFFQQLESEKPVIGGVGVVSFDIAGEGGGQWTVDFSSGKVSKSAGEARLKLRAEARDFMALVEGRMSAKDGVVTERLEVEGDALALTQLGRFLEHRHGMPRA